MGVLILPSKKTLWKPPVGVQIDWGHQLATGLIGCWLLNEAAGGYAFDLANNNKSQLGAGVAAAYPSWVVYGSRGYALRFNGSSHYCRIPYHPKLSPPRLTLQVSFTVGTFTTPVGLQSIIHKAFTSHNTPYYQYDIHYYASGQMGWNLSIDGALNQNATASAVLTTLDKWYVATLTYDGSNINLYLDGVLVKSASASGSVSDYATVFDFGRFTNLAYFFNGRIGDVSLYNRALTPDEIAWLYTEPYCFLQPVIRRFYSIPEEIKVMNRIYRPVKQQSPTIPVRQLGI